MKGRLERVHDFRVKTWCLAYCALKVSVLKTLS